MVKSLRGVPHITMSHLKLVHVTRWPCSGYGELCGGASGENGQWVVENEWWVVKISGRCQWYIIK